MRIIIHNGLQLLVGLRGPFFGGSKSWDISGSAGMFAGRKGVSMVRIAWLSCKTGFVVLLIDKYQPKAAAAATISTTPPITISRVLCSADQWTVFSAACIVTLLKRSCFS